MAWPPNFSATVANPTYRSHPYVYMQARYDSAGWGSRTAVFTGSAIPEIGHEVPLTGQETSGGRTNAGFATQVRVICAAAGRPQRPLYIQIKYEDSGDHKIV